MLRDIAILDKALLLSAVSFVAFVPFLIVLAAVSPIEEVHTFSGTLQMAMGLTNEAAGAVAKLFAPANRIAAATTIVGLVVLATTAVAFVGTLQQNYELIWNMPRCPRVQRWWRHPVWLTVFLSFGLLLAIIQVGIEGGANENSAADVAAIVATALFFSWSEYFLLAGRVPKREVIPGGVATAIGLLGLHGFSKLFFSGMIVDQSHDYGLIGVVFVLMSWLVGAGVVLVGGPAVGAVISRRIFHPRHPHYVYNLHHWRTGRHVHRVAGRPERRVPGDRHTAGGPPGDGARGPASELDETALGSCRQLIRGQLIRVGPADRCRGDGRGGPVARPPAGGRRLDERRGATRRVGGRRRGDRGQDRGCRPGRRARAQRTHSGGGEQDVAGVGCASARLARLG